MQTSFSLQDYRLRYPHTAEYPTLTQTGALALLLARADARAAKEQRRRERAHRFKARIHEFFRRLRSPEVESLPLRPLGHVPGL